MTWDKPRIRAALRKLHRTHANLAYSKMAKTHSALLSAAAYHFGSYRDAVKHAGIDYRQIVRRPRWTKQAIIALIKKARRRGENLHWSAVTKRGDELARAAFASLQPRLFRQWARAIHAAGLDADDISRYRSWDRNTIVFELRARHQAGDPLNSGALQQDEPALHAAAIRGFGSYERALRAAHFNPTSVQQRRRWSRQSVVAALKRAHHLGRRLSDSETRKHDPALHGAAVRLFGTFTKARKAAKIPWKRSKARV